MPICTLRARDAARQGNSIHLEFAVKNAFILTMHVPLDISLIRLPRGHIWISPLAFRSHEREVRVIKPTCVHQETVDLDSLILFSVF